MTAESYHIRALAALRAVLLREGSIGRLSDGPEDEMDGLMAPILRTGIKAYLKDRFGARFTGEDYDRLADEFTKETSREEFSALRKLEGDDRRALIREIADRIRARIRKSGSKQDKEMMKRFMKARAETSPARPAKGARGKKKKKA
ncbi:MAG: hypothetical protein ACE5FC_03105 [Myxococcota bacterium]